MTMGDRIAVMKAGVIQQVADPITIYNSPANVFVAGFIGSPSMSFFKGSLIQAQSRLWFAEPNASKEIGSGEFAFPLDTAGASRLSGYAGKSLILGLRIRSFRGGSGFAHQHGSLEPRKNFLGQTSPSSAGFFLQLGKQLFREFFDG